MNERGAHHAVIFEGKGSVSKARIEAYIEERLSIPAKANPDVEIIEVERFTIHDARSLKERAYQSAFSSARVFVIVSDTILREAQNALLKLFEEPAVGTHFILLVPNRHHLLPTVKSRLLFIERVIDVPKELTFAEAFLRGTIADRQKLLAPLLKDKDRVRAREILDSIEYLLHGDIRTKAHNLREVAFVRTYVSDTSSSLKLLFEHLAVCL